MSIPVSPEIIGSGREKFLIYGDPGMGKTHLALTAPDPIYFLAVGGVNELKTYYSKYFQDWVKKHRKGKKVDLQFDVATEDVEEKGKALVPKGFDRACELLDAALESDDKGEFEFNTLVVDNATVLTEYQSNKVIKVAEDSQDPSKPGFNSYKKYKDSGILTLFDNDYNAVMSLMQKFSSWLFSLNKNLVFIAHEYETTVPNRARQSQDVVGVKPLFIGKQRDRIANAFDNVWRMTKNGQLYEARTVPQSSPYSVIAKTRVGGIVDPDYASPNLTDTIERFKEYADEV